MVRIITRNKLVNTYELANYLEFLLITTRFETTGNEKWTMNYFLIHNTRCKASLIIKD
jgi:hypothetical protein